VNLPVSSVNRDHGAVPKVAGRGPSADNAGHPYLAGHDRGVHVMPPESVTIAAARRMVGSQPQSLLIRV
jgi:hypothetical protein